MHATTNQVVAPSALCMAQPLEAFSTPASSLVDAVVLGQKTALKWLEMVLDVGFFLAFQRAAASSQPVCRQGQHLPSFARLSRNAQELVKQ